MRSLVRSEPHAEAVRRFSEWAAFVEWENIDGKVDWEEADRRMEVPTFYYRRQD